MTYGQWLAQAYRDYGRGLAAFQRVGQYLYNSLAIARPDIARKINATDDDPFYDNTRIDRFLERVEREWHPDRRF